MKAIIYVCGFGLLSMPLISEAQTTNCTSYAMGGQVKTDCRTFGPTSLQPPDYSALLNSTPPSNPYEDAKAEPEVRQNVTEADMIVASVYEGIKWANIDFVTQRNEKSMFCVPPKLKLTPSQLMSMIDDQIKRNPVMKHEPVAIVMIFALKESFPCA